MGNRYIRRDSWSESRDFSCQGATVGEGYRQWKCYFRCYNRAQQLKWGLQTYFDWVSEEWSLGQLMLFLISTNQRIEFLPWTNRNQESTWKARQQTVISQSEASTVSHWPIRAGGFQTEIMLTGEHQSCEGIIKINCRPLEQSQLRKLDKNEKILAITLSGVSKGRQRMRQL